MLHDYNLLTIDLSLFGEGEGVPAGGEASAPAEAAAPAASEVRYGKQPEQTAAPQQEQTQNPPAPDKGKTFREMIRGEYRDQYAEETQKLINRRFRDTDAKIQSMQPIIDALDARYGTNGDMGKLMSAIEGDTAYWQEAADDAGMTVEQYQRVAKIERENKQLIAAQQSQQARYMASLQYSQWQAEAENMKAQYPDFDLDTAMENDLFTLMLKNKYPMEQAFKAAFSDQIAAKAAASAEKAVTDNIKARGNRPAEAGSKSAAPFTVKDDVSKLTKEEVLDSFNRILAGEKISFG